MKSFKVFPGCVCFILVFTFRLVCGDITDGNAEHLKREHSLMKPYQGVGTSPSSQWDFSGSTLVTSSYVRLTPDERSKQGSIWNTVPCYLKDWEMHVHFKVHGLGKKNLHGDGIALWYTKDKVHPGPVFSDNALFHGLAVFIDTYSNDDSADRSFPYVSAMVNNGSLSYDHGKDGRSSELGGCSAEIRNRESDTYLAIRYSKSRLTVMLDVDDKNEWKECIDIGGVRLPTGYYFGASAATGDLSVPQYYQTTALPKHAVTQHHVCKMSLRQRLLLIHTFFPADSAGCVLLPATRSKNIIKKHQKLQICSRFTRIKSNIILHDIIRAKVVIQQQKGVIVRE
ncbi:vesicular integral-membrane protein VIP36 isoform X2 [Dunckerocampus dactyliophorus]|uniref:vesicular integral-membrane protein VIP36 isoform X2 n=1 Tax=Dunckerocampus dactyliophorus TaxID=161453 RepID=UPI002406EF11|nr:vesicular integral-membrane protein VIP36 isoform X2 [Dunckerocampus dactyliophorus]